MSRTLLLERQVIMNIQLTPAQKITVNQKMVQTSEILQMNTTDLQQYLTNLALENPLMDFEPPHDETEYKREWLKSQDEQNRVYERQERKDSQDPWNLDAAMTETLGEALIFQLNGLSLQKSQRKILEYMILNLEPSGYLEMPLEEIAEAVGSSGEDVSDLLQILQTLEPDGIGARSLPECLAIQLKKLHPEDQTALLLAENYLEMVGKNQMPALAKKLHVSLDEVLRACRVIRSLNPRPGASFGDRRYMQYIHPDLVIVKFEGYYDILLNDAALPPIRFNDYYLDLLANSDSEDAIRYLSQKKEQLEWIQQCIRQRSSTLNTLGHLIVERQQAFFQNGPGYLHSFSQAEAAAALSVHESVISRAVKDKYLQCSFGIFPLSYFFVQGMEKKDEIRRRIRELIEQEEKKQPLSDQKISDRLAAEGLAVSKRLVTKYRNEMGLSDASGRKVY